MSVRLSVRSEAFHANGKPTYLRLCACVCVCVCVCVRFLLLSVFLAVYLSVWKFHASGKQTYLDILKNYRTSWFVLRCTALVPQGNGVRRAKLVYACVCVCVCVCANTNAREGSQTWPWRVLSHLLFVFVCEDVSSTLFSIGFGNGEQTGSQVSRRTLSVWNVNAGPPGGMWSGLLWRGCWDVCVCVRACVFGGVFVCVWWGCITDAFRGLFFKWRAKSDFCFVARCMRVCVCVVCMCVWRRLLEKSIQTWALTRTQSSFVCVCVRGCITDALWSRLLKWRSEGYSNSTSNFVSGNCKCGSVRWDVIRAAVTWALRCVCARVCLCVCVCVFGEDVSRMRFEVYFWNEEQRGIQLSGQMLSAWVQMQVRQLKCVQGSCDVDE